MARKAHAVYFVLLITHCFAGDTRSECEGDSCQSFMQVKTNITTGVGARTESHSLLQKRLLKERAVASTARRLICPDVALENQFSDLLEASEAGYEPGHLPQRETIPTSCVDDGPGGCAKACSYVPLPEGCGFERLSDDQLIALFEGRRIWFHGDSTVGNTIHYMHQLLLQRAKAAELSPDKLALYGDSTLTGDSTLYGAWCIEGKDFWLSDETCDYPTMLSPNATTNLAWGLNYTRNLLESDLAVVNTHGLWALLGKNKTWKEALAHVDDFAKKIVDGVCQHVEREGPPMLTVWTLTNSIVDKELHIDPEHEQPLMYDALAKELNGYELRKAHQLLELQSSECRDRIVFVDTYHLTNGFPQCTRGQGDGRHYIHLTGEVWQLIGNAYSQWHARVTKNEQSAIF